MRLRTSPIGVCPSPRAYSRRPSTFAFVSQRKESLADLRAFLRAAGNQDSPSPAAGEGLRARHVPAVESFHEHQVRKSIDVSVDHRAAHRRTLRKTDVQPRAVQNARRKGARSLFCLDQLFFQRSMITVKIPGIGAERGASQAEHECAILREPSPIFAFPFWRTACAMCCNDRAVAPRVPPVRTRRPGRSRTAPTDVARLSP